MASFKQISKYNWEVSFYADEFLGEKRKVKKRGFRTKKEAEEYAIETINKKVGSIEIKFSTLAREFIEYKRKYIKPGTVKNYESYTKKIENNEIGNIKLNDLTKRHIFNFLDSFNYNKSTPSKMKAYIKLVFDYANIHYNFKNFDILKFKLDKKLETGTEIVNKEQIWTLEDFEKFDKILKEITRNEHLKNRALFNVLYYTGARIGEICALTLDDVDFEKKTININKTRTGMDTFQSPKTKSSNRTVAIPDRVSNILKEYIDSIPSIKKMFIFSHPRSYWGQLDKLIKRYNLKKIRLHDFRHSHASLLIKKGIPITDISRRLGHATPNITLMTYSHFYNESQDSVVEMLNDIV